MPENAEKDLKTVNKTLKFFLTMAIVCIALLIVFGVYKQISNTDFKEKYATEIKTLKDKLLEAQIKILNLESKLKQAEKNADQTKNELLKQNKQLLADLETIKLHSKKQEAKRLQKLKEWTTALAKLENYQEDLRRQLKKGSAQITEWKRKFTNQAMKIEKEYIRKADVEKIKQELAANKETNLSLEKDLAQIYEELNKIQGEKDGTIAALENIVSANDEKQAFLVALIDQYILQALHAKGGIIGQLDFNLGRSRLSKAEYAELRPIVQILNQLDVNQYEVIIVGHTDLVPHKSEVPLNATGLSTNRAKDTYVAVYRHSDFQNQLLAVLTQGSAHYRKGKRVVEFWQIPRKKFDALKALENIKSEVKE